MAEIHTLVIGYGNTLRGDDGVGYQAAEMVDSWGVPHVRSLACHQLTPELAADIAMADQVIFLDAQILDTQIPALTSEAPESCQPIRLGQPLNQPFPSNAPFSAHHSRPESLMELAQQLYGCTAIAYIIPIPTHDFSYGEALSPLAVAGLAQALQQVRQILAVGGANS